MSRQHSSNRHPSGFWYGSSPCISEDNQASFQHGIPRAAVGQEPSDQERMRGAPYLIDQHTAPFGNHANPYQGIDRSDERPAHEIRHFAPLNYKVIDHDKEYVIETQAYIYGEDKKIPMIITVVGSEVRLSIAINGPAQGKAPEYRIAIPYGVNYAKISAIVTDTILRIHLPKYIEVIKPTVQAPKEN